MFAPNFHLCQHLIGEAVGHHKARVAGRATEVDQPAFRQQQNAVALREGDFIDLRFDVRPLVLADLLNLNFRIEVADVTDDGLIFHLLHMPLRNHIATTRSGHKNIAELTGLIHRHHFEASHRGLQRANGVDLGDNHAGVLTLQ